MPLCVTVCEEIPYDFNQISWALSGILLPMNVHKVKFSDIFSSYKHEKIAEIL